MIKNILAVFAGLATAFVIIFVFEAIGHIIYPPPPEIDLSNSDHVRQLIESMPVGALIIVIIAWAIGSFAGGVVSSIVAISHKTMLAIIVGALITVSAFINLMMVYHPAWMWVCGLLAGIPFAWWGSIVIRKNTIVQQ